MQALPWTDQVLPEPTQKSCKNQPGEHDSMVWNYWLWDLAKLDQQWRVPGTWSLEYTEDCQAEKFWIDVINHRDAVMDQDFYELLLVRQCNGWTHILWDSFVKDKTTQQNEGHPSGEHPSHSSLHA